MTSLRSVVQYSSPYSSDYLYGCKATNLWATFALIWSRKFIGAGAAEEEPPRPGYSSIVGIEFICFALSTLPFSIVIVLFRRDIGFELFN